MKIVSLVFLLSIILNLPGLVINIPGDFPTITEGLANSQSYDTLLVAEGEYQENVIITHPISIFGSGQNQTSVTGVEIAQSTILVQADSVNLMDINIIGIDSSDWMMEPAGEGIEIQNSSSFLLSNCAVSGGNGIWGDDGSDGAEALIISDSYNIIVSNSSITGGDGDYGYYFGGSGGDGLHINSSNQLSILDCTINAGDGDCAISSPGTCGGSGGKGIFFNLSSDIQILECTITGGYGDYGDPCSGSGGDGIFLNSTINVIADSVSSTGGGSYASGGNGVEAIINSYITLNNSFLEGGNGNPSGSPYYSDSTSTIIINTNINNNLIQFDKRLTLNQNYPNPFNPSTTISFSIPQYSKVDLSIYNIKGQKINTLTHDNFNEGNYIIIWNGDNKSGESVSSGVYLFRLNVDGKNEAMKKCLLLK